MKKIHLTFFILCFTIFTMKAQIPTSLTGNWINENSNEWEYGFFEDFAIYDSDFRTYNSITEKKNKVYLSFDHDGKSVDLEIEQKNDSIVDIKKKGDKKATRYMLMRQTYPAYKTKDEFSFRKPDFKTDSVTIVGYYRNMDKVPQEYQDRLSTNVFEISVPDFVKDESTDHLTSIDSLGRFEVTFPIMNVQETWADWSRLTKVIVVEPGDKSFLFADMLDFIPRESDGGWDGYQNRKKQTLYMGDNARLNNEMNSYKALPLYGTMRDAKEKGMGDMEGLRFCENIYNQRIAHLNQYISENPNVSEKFRYYKATNEKISLAHSLMQHYFSLFGTDKKQFEDGYFEYVQEHFPLDDEMSYTLFRDFKSFLTDYASYAEYKATGGKMSFTVYPKDIMLEMSNRGLLTDENEKDFISFDSLINKLNEAEGDTIRQKELYPQISELSEKIDMIPNVQQIREEMFLDYFFYNAIQNTDTLLVNPYLKELRNASLLYSQIDHARVPLTGKMEKEYNQRVKLPALRKVIDDQNNYYKEIQERGMAHESSLKNRDDLEDVYEAEKILDELFKPYAGKVIYLDFWGTWCGPCKEQMQYAKGLKEDLKDKDVIFMYLANNSPEQSWRSVIKEMELTGENVVHYRLPNRQQAMVEQFLSVRSWPTYMLVNKEGEIVDKKAPRPQDRDNVIKQIDELLK